MATRDGVKWGIAIPQIFPQGRIDLPLVRQFVIRAEILGYDSLWVQEHIEEYEPNIEPLALLGYAAAFSTGLSMGTSVLLSIFRNPVHLAKAFATIDHMLGGRVIVGVGLGAEPTRYPAFGVTPERRVRQFVEGLRVMKALWTEQEARYEGEYWRLDGTPMEPKPLQQPHPPIWFGGRHPDVLRRAARMGDGWIGAGASSTDVFRENVKDLRRELEQEGRDPADFPIAKRIYLALDTDRERAGRRLTEWFVRRYRNADMTDRVAVWGNAQDCIDGISAVIESGAQILQINPVFDHMEHLEGLARDVIPAM